MPERDAPPPNRPVTRRTFLSGAAATGVAIVAGCSSDDSSGSSAPAGPSTGSPTTIAATTTTPVTRSTATSTSSASVDLPGDPFTLGVASGDPDGDRVVLWTRLAPAPRSPERAGMPDVDVDVRWEVARDREFADVVARGTAFTDASMAHSVHVDAEGLEPGVAHYYRFSLGQFTSPIGRTMTFGDASSQLASMRIAVVCCQMREFGHYAAYRDLAEQRPDLVVHLGDYTYEHSFEEALPGRRPLPHEALVTLDDFRLRFASYKSDPDLQAAHGTAPFVCMWDDHEVADNYAGSTFPDASVPEERVRTVRTAAYRAFWEHLPLRLPPPDGPNVTLYRDLVFGDLATLYMLDERQYADIPPCRDGGAVADAGYCDAVDEPREYLGQTQQAWFAEAVGVSAATWNLVGNPTVIAGVNEGTPERPSYYVDTWDGYPLARRQFLDVLASDEVRNPLLLTGDWHAGMVNDVRLDPADPTTSVVCTELMTPAISSPVFGVNTEGNPHIRHAFARNGYMVAEVNHDSITATFKAVDELGDRRSAVSDESAWRIDAGKPTATRL